MATKAKRVTKAAQEPVGNLVQVVDLPASMFGLVNTTPPVPAPVFPTLHPARPQQPYAASTSTGEALQAITKYLNLTNLQSAVHVDIAVRGIDKISTMHRHPALAIYKCAALEYLRSYQQ